MKKCNKCHISDYPDTATTCTKCGHSPLTPYHKKNIGLRHSDFVSLGAHVPEVKSTTTTPAMILPLLGALLLLVFIILPLFFTPKLPSSAFSKPTTTPVPTAPPTATPVPTAPPTATPVPTAPPTATPVPTAPPTATPVPTAPPTATPTPVIHTLTSQVQAQSQTVNATGQSTTPGTQATGTLKFEEPYSNGPAMTYAAGTSFQNNDGMTPNIQIVIDATAVVPPGPNGIVTVPAHVVQVGSIGNIPANVPTSAVGTGFFDDTVSMDIYGNGVHGPVDIYNSTAFTGGTDTQTTVQQSDIDTAAHSLEPSTTLSAITDIRSQLQSNEHLVSDPQCSNTVTSDHLVGDQATVVNVTVETTCTASAST